MSHPLHIVDVFAMGPCRGDPLSVVLDAADLDTEAMQAIAREMDVSETTFVVGRDAAAGRFAVRIFAPSREIPCARHFTLGTAWVMRRHVAPRAADALELEVGVGRVSVRFEGSGDRELDWLRAPEAELGETLTPRSWPLRCMDRGIPVGGRVLPAVEGRLL